MRKLLPNADPKPKSPKKRERRPIAKVSKKRAAQSDAPRYSTITKKPRPKAETVRIHGDEERRAWTKRQPCIVPGCGRTPCDAAHLINGGVGRKADAKWTVPFCSTNPATGYEGHHDQYDGAKRSFLAEHFPGMTRAEIAAPTEAAWLAHVARVGSTGC